MAQQYIILGAGGHAAVIADIIYKCGYSLKGFLDDVIPVGTIIFSSNVLGKIDDCQKHKGCLFIIGIGDNYIRENIAKLYPLKYGIAIHPSAVIGSQVEIGSGSVVMAGAVINPRTDIGQHCIINTKAGIDHDNLLEDYIHISPGAVLGGTVHIGCLSHIGIGAVIKNNIDICARVQIGAGAVVVKNVTQTGVYTGVPAKFLREQRNQ